MTVLINDIINAANAISHSDGERVYGFLKEKGYEDFTLSFEGINRVSTSFLNAVIGRMILEKTYSDKIIDQKTTPTIILNKIKSVKENAIHFPIYNRIVNDVQC